MSKFRRMWSMASLRRFVRKNTAILCWASRSPWTSPGGCPEDAEDSSFMLRQIHAQGVLDSPAQTVELLHQEK